MLVVDVCLSADGVVGVFVVAILVVFLVFFLDFDDVIDLVVVISFVVVVVVFGADVTNVDLVFSSLPEEVQEENVGKSL